MPTSITRMVFNKADTTNLLASFLILVAPFIRYSWHSHVRKPPSSGCNCCLYSWLGNFHSGDLYKQQYNFALSWLCPASKVTKFRLKSHFPCLYGFCSPAKIDMRAICEALGDVETKWFKIGVQLGIPRSKLQEFKKDEDPLSAVVDYWLRGNVTESVTPISWATIVKVLKSKYVGEPGLAEKINKDYCQQEEGK